MAGAAREYSHDEPGAIIAAINLTLRSQDLGGPQVYQAVVRQSFIGDSGPLLAATNKDYATDRRAQGVSYGQPVSDAGTQVVAYRMDDYQPSGLTQIRLVSAEANSAGSTARVSFQITLTWSGKDWKIVAPTSGQYPYQAVSTLAGYTALSPGK